jgi:hypothetical protein
VEPILICEKPEISQYVIADELIANTQIRGQLTSQPYQGRLLQKLKQEMFTTALKVKTHNSYK